jgi:hypothetical protein
VACRGIEQLSVFLKSAKGADARRQTAKQLAGSFGGALDTAAVLREFLKTAIQYLFLIIDEIYASCIL